MPLLDQRILIAAPAEAVWPYLVSPALMVKWHKAARQVAVLSTKTSGVGTRRRITDPRGKNSVEEISAWLENLGYEYTQIDGPFREFRARVRLQPVPEGTLVNWRIEYRLKGLLPGLRNLIQARRRLEHTMAESLRQLRTQVERSGARIDPNRQARFAMRAAPSVEDRAARASVISVPTQGSGATPSTVDAPGPTAAAGNSKTTMTATASPPVASPSAIIPSPPIAEDPNLVDTKPRKPMGLEEALAAGAPRDPGTPDHAALTVPVSLVAPPNPAPPDAQVTQTMDMITPTAPETLPELRPTPRGVFLPGLAPTPSQSTPVPPREPVKPIATTPQAGGGTTEPPIILPPPTNHDDTGEISIWQVFGMEPPSERTRSDLEQIIASLQTQEVPISAPEKAAQPPYPGLLRAIRRRVAVPARHSLPVPVHGQARLQKRRHLSQVRANEVHPPKTR